MRRQRQIWTRAAFVSLFSLFFAIFFTSPLYADLDISGEKTFQFRDYGLKGDFNQFIRENPLFLNDRGFDQSLRLDITGTIGDNVHVDVSLDDSDEDQEDKKLLVRVDGRKWDVLLGRLNLNLPDRDFLLYNRTVLGMMVEGRVGRHRISAMAGRPEGRSERNFFQGNGSQQEYVLTDRDGVRNPQVVQGSEVVDIDSRRLTRGADYTMDYEEGSIIFSQHLLPIDETSRITITFETMDGGSTYQSTIMGFRHEYSLDGTPWTSAPALTEAGGYEKRDYVAWTIVQDADDKSQETMEETSATPQALTVMGVDGAVSLPAGMRLEVEAAHSMYEADALTGTVPEESANAITLDLLRQQGKHSMKLRHQRVEGGFRAVGKDTFAKLGRDDDLVSDVEMTTLDNTLQLTKRLKLQSSITDSTTNLDESDDKPVVDFTRQNHSLYYKRENGGSADFRYLDEGSVSIGGIDPDDELTKEVGSVSTEIPIRGLLLQTSGSIEDNSSLVKTTEDYRKATVGLAKKAGKGNFTWGLSHSVQEVDIDDVMELARLNTQTAINLGAHPSRKLSTDLSLSKRVERNYNQADTERPGRLDIDTGEAKVRWKPHKTVSVSLKGSLEQRSRILAITDDRDVLNSSEAVTENTSSTIITENPVLTFLTSDSIEWRPSRKWDHRLSYRERLERDAVTNERFSENVATDYRGKWSPTKKLRFTGDAVWAESSSKTAGTDRDTYEAGGEALYNFNSGLILRLDNRYTDLDDNVDDLQDEETWARGLKLERNISETWTARGGYRETRKVSSARSLEEAFDLGVVCTPKGSKTRWELAFKNGDIDGTDTSGNQFNSFNRRLTFKMDSRVGKDTRLEGNLERISAGPDGKGGTGFQATTTEVKVSIDF